MLVPFLALALESAHVSASSHERCHRYGISAGVTYVIAGIMNDIGTLAFAALEGFCYHLTYWYEEKKWR
jgi:hypothetical protein